MEHTNFIDEDFLLLERPNIRKECNIKSEEEMNKYLIAYNTYSSLLVQFFMKKYRLSKIDKQLEKNSDIFHVVSFYDKDLYQHLSEGYLKYFYLRNNIHIERLNTEQLNYLFSIYKTNNLELTQQNEKFIEDTYLNIILEDPNAKNVNINYGPDNLQYYKPPNSIIIGVRYNQFENIDDKEENFSKYAKAEWILNLLTGSLEHKIRQETKIPFHIIKYDDYSVNLKKKESNRKGML